jgi:fibronectin type 3 domain-containing protein
VAAGQSIPFKVTFAPQKGGISSGNITFLSDASNSPHAEGLSANGAQTQAEAHSVTLSWRASKSNTIGYNIYRGVSSTGPYSKINSSPHPKATFTDASVQRGQTYFYVTTALNKNGEESRRSNQIQVTIPNS